MLVLALLAALESLSRRQPVRLNRHVLWWLVLVYGLHLLVISSLAWGPGDEFAWRQSYELLLLLVAFTLTSQLFKNEPAYGLSLLLWIFAGTALLFSGFAVLMSGRLVGELPMLGAGGIGAGRVLGMGALALLYAYLRYGRAFFLLPIPPLVAAVLLTGSRAAALALALSLIALLLLESRIARLPARRHKRGSVVKALALSTVLVAGFLATPYGREIAVNFVLSNTLSEAAGSDVGGLYLAGRDVIFVDAWQQFSHNAYGGLGLGGYRGPLGELYPHNMLLSYAVDAGFIALIGALVALAWAVIVLIRARSQLANMALVGASFFLVASLFAGSYYDARFVWIFLLLGLIGVFESNADTSSENLN